MTFQHEGVIARVSGGYTLGPGNIEECPHILLSFQFATLEGDTVYITPISHSTDNDLHLHKAKLNGIKLPRTVI